jgi:hypoxanthine phosphoribosyltransferase
LLVAAAHGSIAPALLLAEYLGIPLYFLRFSMFKRKDEAPIVSLADEAWLSTWRRGKGLIFDEDVAKGTTLDLFAQRLRGLFAESRTACVMRHAGARMKPDFAAHIWWDESC